MKILGIDPGGTTGLAWLDLLTPPQAVIQIDSKQLGLQVHHSQLWDFLTQYMPDVVVCETFQFRQKLGADYNAPEYIGVIRLWCQSYDKELKMQAPQQAKSFVPDWRLQRLGFYETKHKHAMDAIRHIIYFVTADLKSNIFLQKPNSNSHEGNDEPRN